MDCSSCFHVDPWDDFVHDCVLQSLHRTEGNGYVAFDNSRLIPRTVKVLPTVKYKCKYATIATTALWHYQIKKPLFFFSPFSFFFLLFFSPLFSSFISMLDSEWRMCNWIGSKVFFSKAWMVLTLHTFDDASMTHSRQTDLVAMALAAISKRGREKVRIPSRHYRLERVEERRGGCWSSAMHAIAYICFYIFGRHIMSKGAVDRRPLLEQSNARGAGNEIAAIIFGTHSPEGIINQFKVYV